MGLDGACNRWRGAAGLVAILLVFLALPAKAAAPPQRVVSTFLCTDEYVFRLLPREHIAALSWLAADRHPVVSTIADQIHGVALIRPSTEEVMNVAPDLVVMYEGTNPRLRANLSKMHVPVVEVPWAQSLSDVRRITTMLGSKLGVPDRAALLLRQMDRDLAAIRARAVHPAVRTLIYEPNGYATAGGVTDELMAVAGLTNAAPNLRPTRVGTIPVEAVIAAAPQLLILSGRARVQSARADLVLHHPALKALSGKTYAAWTPLTALLCPGPWSVEAASTFAKLGALARNSRQN